MTASAQRRSPILDASQRYWRSVGDLLGEAATEIFGSRRRHMFFVFGGCFFWLAFLMLYVFAVMLVGALFVAVVLALAFLGVLLSAAGGLDQLRLAIFARTRRNAPTV
jgi:hypothetical protein